MTVVDGAWGTCHLPVLQTCQQGILRAFHISRLNFVGPQWRVRQLVRFRHAAGARQAQNACRQTWRQAIIAGKAKCPARGWEWRAISLGTMVLLVRWVGRCKKEEAKLSSLLSKLQALPAPLSSTADPWLQTTRGKTCAPSTSSSAAPPRCNHYTSPCAYPGRGGSPVCPFRLRPRKSLCNGHMRFSHHPSFS